MKRTTLMMGAALVLLGILSTGAFAQSGPLVADVPFDFHFSDERMKAGTYVLKLYYGKVVQVIKSDGTIGRTALSLPAESKQHSSKGVLIFRQYDNRYFLSRIFWPEEGEGRHLFRTDLEIEVAKKSTTSRTIMIRRVDAGQPGCYPK